MSRYTFLNQPPGPVPFVSYATFMPLQKTHIKYHIALSTIYLRFNRMLFNEFMYIKDMSTNQNCAVTSTFYVHTKDWIPK
jgi:hypothetical protein